MNILKNIALNLKAKGPAAVIIIWVLAVTLLGIYGKGELAETALSILAVAGGMMLFSLASKP